MFYVFLAISLVFIASLAIKNYLKNSFCVICVAVASTWLVLLYLYKYSDFNDQILLGLLVGQSITGIFYFAMRKLPKALRIFSLPFLLTLTAIFYWLITSDVLLPVFVLLAVLWVGTWAIFTSRNDLGKKKLADIFADCCEDG